VIVEVLSFWIRQRERFFVREELDSRCVDFEMEIVG
jgi:hypothetical protein